MSSFSVRFSKVNRFRNGVLELQQGDSDVPEVSFMAARFGHHVRAGPQHCTGSSVDLQVGFEEGLSQGKWRISWSAICCGTK